MAQDEPKSEEQQEVPLTAKLEQAFQELQAEGTRISGRALAKRAHVPLVARLRQGGCTVLVIGTAAVSKALKEASSTFLATDQLVPQELPRPALPPVAPPTPALELSALLTQAYQRVFQKNQAEWVLLAQLGMAVRELCPDFEKQYGKRPLSAHIKQCNGCFEVRRRAVGKGEVEEVRVQPPYG